MASIVESIKNIMGDSHPLYKIIFMTALVYGSVKLYPMEYVPSAVKICCIGIVALYIIGFLLTTLNNMTNERAVMMPNPFALSQIFVTSIKSVIALGPAVALVGGLVFFLNNYLKTWGMEEYINIIIISIIALIFLALWSVQLLLFAKKLSIPMAYKLGLVFQCSGDFVMQIIVMAITVALLGALLGGAVGYFIYTLFGFGEVLNIFIIFLSVFLLVALMQYYGQLYFEYIEIMEKKDKI